MAEACLLSPPPGAGRMDLEAYLQDLRAMNEGEPLVQVAIEDAEIALKKLSTL